MEVFFGFEYESAAVPRTYLYPAEGGGWIPIASFIGREQVIPLTESLREWR